MAERGIKWTPKVGEWVVHLHYGLVGEVEQVGINRCAVVFSGTPDWCMAFRLRPATIDEIPGNTSTEEEHDRALGAAIGADVLGDDALSTVISWQHLEGMGYLR